MHPILNNSRHKKYLATDTWKVSLQKPRTVHTVSKVLRSQQIESAIRKCGVSVLCKILNSNPSVNVFDFYKLWYCQ